MKKILLKLMSAVLALSVFATPVFAEDNQNNFLNENIIFEVDTFVTYYDPINKIMYDELPETVTQSKLFTIYHTLTWYQEGSCIALDIKLSSPDTSAKIKGVYGGLTMNDRNSGVSGYQKIRTTANYPIVNILYSVTKSHIVFPKGHTIYCVANYSIELLDGEVLSGKYKTMTKDYVMK